MCEILVKLFFIMALELLRMQQDASFKMQTQFWTDFKTRAPRGTDRLPEYNEHFCYKLDSRVKHLTTEWNQKQQHFKTHASRSLLWIRFVAVAFRS